MIIFQLINMLILIALFPVWLWAMRCIYRTGDDRLRAINAVRFRPLSGPPILKAYEGVTFDQHMRARFLGRDPWALYDPMVLEAIQNPRSDIVEVIPGERMDVPPVIN